MGKKIMELGGNGADFQYRVTLVGTIWVGNNVHENYSHRWYQWPKFEVLAHGLTVNSFANSCCHNFIFQQLQGSD